MRSCHPWHRAWSRAGVRESTTDTVHLPSGSLAYATGVVVGVAVGVVAGTLLLAALFLVYLSA